MVTDDTSPTLPSPEYGNPAEHSSTETGAFERPAGAREIAAMRGQIAFLYRLVIGLAIGVLICFAFAANAVFRSDYKVRELRLMSNGGATRAMLHFEEGYPKLSFYDRDGTERALFDAAGLILYGDDGTTMLRELGDASRLEFKRRYEGVDSQTWIVNDGERQQIVLKCKQRPEEVRLALDFKTGARLQVIDDSGAFVVPTRDD